MRTTRRVSLSILALSLLLAGPARAAAAAVTGLATPGGSLSLSDGEGSLLDLGLLAWGPGFAWSGLKGHVVNEQGATFGEFSGTFGKTGVPFTIDLRATRTGPRALEVVAGVTAEGDTALTLVTLALTPGPRFAGDGHCTIQEGDRSAPHAVPFGRGRVGAAVTALRLDDGKGGATEFAFAAPATIEADGAARIVLAAGNLAANARKILKFTVRLPGDLTWYPTPAEVPFPADWDQWFAWQPTAALTASNAPAASGIGMDDWSREPAGARGRVVREGDRLLVGGVPTKFWGINDCYASCAPARDLADSRAVLYARMGINAVRLHKYADGAGWSGIQAAQSFVDFDPAGLDRMDYFISQLKARGIYVKLSPNFGDIKLGPADADAVPWLDDFAGAGQGRRGRRNRGDRIGAGNGSIYVASELQDLLIRQMTNLLKHRNPYTGLTYAEDPAILVIEEFNENSVLFYGTIKVLATSPTLRARMAERFTDWLAKRYGDEAGLNKAWGPNWKDALAGMGFKGESFAGRSIAPAGNPWFFDPDQLAGSQAGIKTRLLDTMLFLYEVQNDFYKRYADAMRAAGYKGEVLTSNWQAGRALSHYLNLHSDALIGTVDRHNYYGGGNAGASMLTRAGSGMLSSGTCQVGDRPFMLSEWIHVFPNEYGAEGPAIIGAYGMGLQGWDVSFMFQNGDKGGFAAELGDPWAVSAPQVLGLFPAVARQVRRGDVKEATVAAARRVHVPSLAAGKLGFDDQGKSAGDVKEADSATVPARSLAVARNAVIFTDSFAETPAFDLAPFQKDGALAASTGQLRWYEGAQPGIAIDTPGTQAIVGWFQGRPLRLTDVEIDSQTPFAAIYVTAAGPTETIRTAGRLLITTVARARNTEMKFGGSHLLVKGRGPIRLEPVKAEIALKRPGAPTVYACDHDGRRTSTVVPVRDGKVTLDSAQNKTIWYEVVYP